MLFTQNVSQIGGQVKVWSPVSEECDTLEGRTQVLVSAIEDIRQKREWRYANCGPHGFD